MRNSTAGAGFLGEVFEEKEGAVTRGARGPVEKGFSFFSFFRACEGEILKRGWQRSRRGGGLAV